MRMAIDLAAEARGWTSPNPMVGAVVVKDGRMVGKGLHARAGLPHAEVGALDAAGDLAIGADLYVSLEPCSHHGRTPPCTERVLRAGIARVVCAHTDPDPRVDGRGIALLREAGIAVDVGLCESESRRLNEQYIWWKQTGRPWVTLKWAQTLDGQVATRSGQSRWITGEAARTHAHRLRSWHDAVLVGIGTATSDDPGLDVRMVDGRQPSRIVLDSSLRLPEDARLADSDGAVIVCSAGADADKIDAWEHRGVRVLRVDGSPHDLTGVLGALADIDVQSVFVEGGPAVATSFLRAGLVNRVAVFVAPMVLGSGTPAVRDLAVDEVGESLRLREAEMSGVGDDWCLTGLLGDA